MKLTLAFLTGRAEPRLDWMLESLAPQVIDGDEIDVLVVDARGRLPEDLGALSRYGRWDASSLRVVSPKPTIWSGPSRVTSCDWWSKSSAINTALIHAAPDAGPSGGSTYIAFCDDACRLSSTWLDTVRQSERERASVIAGAYTKSEGGGTTYDHRLGIVPDGRKNCDQGWLFGCTYALPMAWLLEINGAEEGVDGLGAEDIVMGMMLTRTGRRIDYVPAMAVHQDRPEISRAGVGGSGSIPLKRTNKGEGKNDKSHRALELFGTRKCTDPRFTPDLVDLRRRIAAGESWPEPVWALRNARGQALDWFDQCVIAEM